MDFDEDKAWNLVASGAAIAMAMAIKPVLERLWTALFGKTPPGNPASAETTWREAVTWSLASGAAIGVARLVAQRAAAAMWYRRRGAYPGRLHETHA